MQSVSLQFMTDANKVVCLVKNEFHQFFQEAYLIILFPVYYVQQGPSALRLSAVYDNEGRRISEGIC